MNSNSLIHQEILPNGLVLLGEELPRSQSCALGYFVATGARDEKSEVAGVSHFLEHMMFKGTPTRSALDITYALGNMGAQANAFTSEESTVFYASVLPEFFGPALELLTDMLRPALTQEDFDTEKQVILEEIALYQDRPHFYLFEHSTKQFFGDHPAGNSVLGSTASIAALTSEQMRDYFTGHYCPNRMALVAAGRFDWDELRRFALAVPGKWPEGVHPRGKRAFVHSPKQVELRKPNLQQAHVLLMAPSCDQHSEHRYALAVLSTILGDSSGSKIYWALVDPGLVDGAGADVDEKDDCGVFMAHAGTEVERLDRVAGILRGIMSDPSSYSDAELERAKTKLLTRIVLGGEMPLGRAMSIGNEWCSRRKLFDSSELSALVRGVSRESIAAALDAFPLTEWSEFRLIPE